MPPPIPFMKDKLLLIGYRAYGDWLYTLPVLPYLFDRYDVHIELNGKGYELFRDDPRFKGITLFDIEGAAAFHKEKSIEIAEERWKHLERKLNPDRVINLWRSLETECIAENYMPEFYEPNLKRRERFGNKNFYEAVFNRCGIEMPDKPVLDSLWFSEKETAWGEWFKNKFKDKFTVIMPIAGSCSHKVYPDMPRLSYEILERYHDAVIFLVGDSTVAHAQWEHERIIHTCGKMPFKQVVMMAKHVDMVIGGETGAVVAAGTWGTPKIMLCTASSIYQCCHYHKNDFSMQADVSCSPCHRAIYTTLDCENMIEDGEDNYPGCITGFDYKKILERVDAVYGNL